MNVIRIGVRIAMLCLSGLFVLVGVFAMFSANSVMHELFGLMALLIAAVLGSSVVVADSVDELRRQLKTKTERIRQKKLGVVQDHEAA